ncbi:YtxH domain-containing protein, partial [Escherichia coli]|nr:YtxH domain-containing protein [Escherichia coli]
IKRAVAGGIIGATIGYVSTPENRKSLLDRIDTDELKSKASDLGTKVKEKSKSSVASLKTSAGSLFKKDKDKDKSKDDEENVNSSSS